MTQEVERRMNRVLEKLGLPLGVKWTPDPHSLKRALLELQEH